MPKTSKHVILSAAKNLSFQFNPIGKTKERFFAAMEIGGSAVENKRVKAASQFPCTVASRRPMESALRMTCEPTCDTMGRQEAKDD